MRKYAFLILLLTISPLFSRILNAQNVLLIRPESIRLTAEKSGTDGKIIGYHLYVKKVEGLESVLLTETTKDPEGKADNYAYRAFDFNETNGNEKRILDGNELKSEYSKFSLIDSSSEPDKIFGEAFHIFIPQTLRYGYPWTRNGTVEIKRGTFINIRAFSTKYADYSGEFYENPYMFDFAQEELKKTDNSKNSARKENADFIKTNSEQEKEISILTDDYNPIASAKFEELSEVLIYSKGPKTIINDIMTALYEISPKEDADVVFAVDTTGSMKDDIEMLRKEWIPHLAEGIKKFRHIRLGLLLYRDYGSNYNYKGIPVKFFNFTEDVAAFTKNLNAFTIHGNEGGDIPEAVYEGLYGALEFYKWNSDAVKKIILIGDAEPHPVPRGSGKYTKELISKTASEKGISINAIITPDEKSRRGR